MKKISTLWDTWLKPERRNPSAFEYLMLIVVTVTLVFVGYQIRVATNQLGVSQRLTAAVATLDFIDRMVDECRTLKAGEWTVQGTEEDRKTSYSEIGSSRIWRLKAEMIDDLRDGNWDQVNLTYKGADGDEAPGLSFSYYSLRFAVCDEVRENMPTYAVVPQDLDQDQGEAIVSPSHRESQPV